MNYTFLSATILLILITDPVGNIPIFVKTLRHVAPHRRTLVIVREVMIAFVSLQIAGGVILFLIALRMIFPPIEHKPDSALATDELLAEPLIVPLAIPALAGPSALATVMLLVSQAPERKLEWVAALTVTMLVCAVVLVLAERIQRLLGERVVIAVERLMGLILVAVSVEMLLRGFKAVAQDFAKI
jgi:small neutral amino acid transporter SnatA (MarC family)